jgi:hypothetical protein
MKRIKLYEEFLTEKAYRLSGPYAAKGIIGKVMQSFKKEIEKIAFGGDSVSILEEINGAWKGFHTDGVKIILDEVQKAVKDMEQVAYVHVSGLNQQWEADTRNSLNNTGGSLYISLPKDFVISVGFMDDTDAGKFSKKLGGMQNTTLAGGEDIHGSFDAEIGENNVEISGSEVMQIDAK